MPPTSSAPSKTLSARGMKGGGHEETRAEAGSSEAARAGDQMTREYDPDEVAREAWRMQLEEAAGRRTATPRRRPSRRASSTPQAICSGWIFRRCNSPSPVIWLKA